MTRPRLWVLCPVYLDVDSFLVLRERVVAEIVRLGSDAPSVLRFVVVDDSAGRDPSMATLEALPDVRVVPVPFNLGHQRAIVFGLRSLAPLLAPADYVVTMDADGEDRPDDLPRLLAALRAAPDRAMPVVLAWRTSRTETWRFSILYRCFQVLFRVLTGTVIKTGNYAAFHGAVARQLIQHPVFDLTYSSAFLSLRLNTIFVPCPRGHRYAGSSRMLTMALIGHGLGMLMPFMDRIATRALVALGLVAGVGATAGLIVLGIRLLTPLAIPGWASVVILLTLALSVGALGNFVVLFALYAQSAGFAFRSLHEPVATPRADSADALGSPDRNL